MLMSPSKGETAVHGCHCPGGMVVRIRKVWPYRGVETCASVLKLVLKSILVRVSARFELARVGVIGSRLYQRESKIIKFSGGV